MLTRFAPAPTGWLHLGHVLNAEYVWGSGAKVLLRIEDHDRERCRPEYDAGILEDLDWLGYRPDFPVVRQSDRDAIYRDAVHVLAAQGLVYGCDCTRKEIEGEAGPPAVALAKSEARGAGDCGAALLRPMPRPRIAADRRRRLARADGSRRRAVRGRAPRPAGTGSFAAVGDVLIRDRLGNWTYQFAASVDDYRQGIDLVIRGEDLLPSTGRQIRLARLLGRAQPAAFHHHPLIMKSPDQKLSKSDGDTGDPRPARARLDA